VFTTVTTLELKGLIMRSERLPPGQREAKGTPLRQIGTIPKTDLNTWRLEVYGEVEKPTTFSFEELKAEPSVVSVSDFHCVEGWSIPDNKWEGVPFRAITEIVKPKENAIYVTFECDDGYTTSLPLPELLGDNVLLAYKLNDKPLPQERGEPLRLIIPSKYAYKSPKWIRKIKFTSKQELGYWESRGYSNTADAWKEERYTK
jgi:DMSO/TMAO reductase YedYZ molybdopterin-dependent catalytic subunit